MQILVCVSVGSAVTYTCASVQLDERVCEHGMQFEYKYVQDG